MAPLKLQALDADDLKIISAQCQDAILRTADFSYNPANKSFSFICNRFDWQAAAASKRRDFERRQAVLRFARVTRARFSGLEGASIDGVLDLLAISFEPGEPPSGVIRLLFAAGAEVRLDVECIEVELKDTGASWSAGAKPDHGTTWS